MRFQCLCVALAVVAFATSASATFLLKSDGRSVSAVGQNCTEPEPGGIECDAAESELVTPAAPFSVFDATAIAGLGYASQTSSANPIAGTLTATGSASSFSDVGFGEGTSTFEIEFSTGTPMSIVLSGRVGAEGDFGQGDSFVRFEQDGLSLYEVDAEAFSGDFDEEVVSYEAVLSPGTYRLRAVAGGFAGSYSSYDLDLTSSPAVLVEPATAALVVGGLAGLLGARRRHPA